MSITPYYQKNGITLYHGDARDVLPTLEGVSGNIVTDPPYAVSKSGQMLGFVSPNWKEKATHSRGYADHDRHNYSKLIGETFRQAFRMSTPGTAHVAFGGNRTFHQMVTQIEKSGFEALDVLVFNSTGVAKSRTTLAPSHEIASLFRTPGKPPAINPDWRKRNRFDIPKPKRGRNFHLTPKPTAWMTELIELVSEPGDLIIDPFAGSGTTLIAAAQTGRMAVGVEIDEAYCELAATRLEQE